MTTKRRLDRPAVVHLLVWAAVVVLSVLSWLAHWREFFPPRWVFAHGGVLLALGGICIFLAATLPTCRKTSFSELVEMFEPDLVGIALLVWGAHFFLLYSGKLGAAAGKALAAASFCGVAYLGAAMVKWAWPRFLARVNFKRGAAPTPS
ncbi:MAG: hypothetical protein M1275_03015 [Patescibacteria group bacterium]|nr:hypothetical protein [Patescibacteria group bacterium]